MSINSERVYNGKTIPEVAFSKERLFRLLPPIIPEIIGLKVGYLQSRETNPLGNYFLCRMHGVAQNLGVWGLSSLRREFYERFKEENNWTINGISLLPKEESGMSQHQFFAWEEYKDRLVVPRGEGITLFKQHIAKIFEIDGGEGGSKLDNEDNRRIWEEFQNAPYSMALKVFPDIQEREMREIFKVENINKFSRRAGVEV